MGYILTGNRTSVVSASEDASKTMVRQLSHTHSVIDEEKKIAAARASSLRDQFLAGSRVSASDTFEEMYKEYAKECSAEVAAKKAFQSIEELFKNQEKEFLLDVQKQLSEISGRHTQSIVADSRAAYDIQPKAQPFPALDPDETVYAAWAERIEADMPKDYVPVRYYKYAALSAGHGAENADHEPDALLFSKKFIKYIGIPPKDLMLVRVRGDSMSPTLLPGWTVMLDTRQRTIGSGIYALRMGNEELCKRLEYRPGGVVRVISDNTRYEEYEINLNAEHLDFSLMGKVIWVAGLV